MWQLVLICIPIFAAFSPNQAVRYEDQRIDYQFLSKELENEDEKLVQTRSTLSWVGTHFNNPTEFNEEAKLDPMFLRVVLKPLS